LKQPDEPNENGENDASHPLPPTVSMLTADLRALGITAGMTLLVHSSLKAIAD
jgi:aminoglycoside N3'-acetyltransferase